MMRRLVALLALLLVTAACLVVDAAIALSPNQLALRVRNQLKEQLASCFDFDSVSFSFADGLVVRGFQIGDPARPALTAEKITIRMDIRRLRITKVLIEKPCALLLVKSEGTTNFDGIFKHHDEEVSPPSLPEIDVRRGSLMAEVEFAADDIVRASLDTVDGGFKPGSGGGAELVVIAVGKEIGKIEVAGTLSSDMKSANLQARTQNLDVSRLKTLLPDQVETILDDLQLAGKVNLSASLRIIDGKPDFEAAIESLGCIAKYKQFPLPLCDITGTVRITPGEIRLVDFKGNTFANPFTVAGTVELMKPKPRVELSIHAPDLQASEELIQSTPENEREIIRQYAPEGRADVKVHLHSCAELSEPETTVRIDAKGSVSVSYYEFPYRLENLTGSLVITRDRVDILNVTSAMDSQVITGTGYALPSEDGVEVSVNIEGRNIAIDDKLKGALSEENQETWDSFSPSGRAGVNVRITSKAREDKVDVAAEICLDGAASVRPVDFPLEISGITGTLRFSADGPVQLINITGSTAGGNVKVADTSIPVDERSKASVDVCFSGVSLGREVINALASAVEEDLGELQAGGLLSGSIGLCREQGSGEFDMFGEVTLENGWIVHDEFPIKAEQLTGRLLIYPNRYDLRYAKGKAAGGRLEAWGEIRRQDDGKDAIRVRVEGFELVADKELEDALPAEIRETYRDFEPYGSFDAAIWLDGTTPLEEGVRKTLRLRLRDMAGKYAEFPYQVYGIRGEARVDIDKGEIKLQDLHTKDRRITVDGSILTTAQRTVTDLHVEARSLQLDKALRDAMPEEVLELWNDIELEGVSSGTVNLHLDQLAGGEPAVEYNILLRPENASLFAGFPMEKLKGKVTLKGRVTAEGEHELERGLIQLSDFEVNGLPVTWASSLLELTDESLTLSPITGRMANGTLLGRVRVEFDEDSSYSGVFDLKDASVKLAAQQLFGEKMEKTTGRAEASIVFKGKGSDESSLAGEGKVKLSKSNLWEVPFFSKLVKALSLGAVPSVDFTESYGKFKIKGRKLLFNKVYFHSPILNLDGAGELSLDGRISFTFKITVFSNWLSKIDPTGLSSWVLKIIEGELNAVRATGTAKKVTIQLGPKKWLDALKLLEGAEKDEDK